MRWKLLVLTLLLTLVIPFGTASAKEQDKCEALSKIFRTPVKQEDGVCKLEITRKNLEVSLMGQKLSPDMMDLAFMVDFEKVEKGTVVIGEFALLEEEINPVIDELRRGGLEISALHNHKIEESPNILYLHFQGIGDLVKSAESIKNAINRTSSKIP
ncbi:hypothetical protein J31TS4_20900 [Paenibacillus sp. J31TS4]|uniref:DUF1259 domain-containing protein n=1 Tax=Paenibacillus sp. J31TS4 TaxID=2807195 RepID=UPI001B05A12C|nr:DUF1259 domain-containing protein [Paenibacillus sp. J31TS4]GIP38810.1 hypothetical protein J31TS4_20900 [Paenibacillus sp. J31TS4]